MSTVLYWSEIQDAALKHALDPILLAAQVLVESSSDPLAFRYEPAFWKTYLKGKPHVTPLDACSYGLLQILGVVAREQGFKDPLDCLFLPSAGLYWGAKYLKQLIDWAGGNVDSALAAYNGGRNGNKVPPYRNQAYVDNVRGHVQIVKARLV